jgi:NADH-quinone oxidoreductase subunit C
MTNPPKRPDTTADAATPDPVTSRAEARVREAFPDAVEEVVATGPHPFLAIRADRLHDVCLLLRDDEEMRYDCLHLLSGVDRPAEKKLEVVYHLVSYGRPWRPGTGDVRRDGWLALKVRVPRDDPRVPSVADVWTGADWHERETWDLLGIVFTGRKELRRIFLPEDWPGHPLRKDWEFPASYHGVPIIPPEAQ